MRRAEVEQRGIDGDEAGDVAQECGDVFEGKIAGVDNTFNGREFAVKQRGEARQALAITAAAEEQ